MSGQTITYLVRVYTAVYIDLICTTTIELWSYPTDNRLQTTTSRQHLSYYDYSEMFSTNQLPPRKSLCQTPWMKCFFIQKYLWQVVITLYVFYHQIHCHVWLQAKPCIYHVSIPNSNHLIQHKCYVCVPLLILTKHLLDQTNIFYNTMLPVGLSHTQQKFLTSTETETV